MCRRFPFMSLDWSELLAQVEDLPHEAQRAVLILVGETWRRGEPYRDDDHVLARALGVTLHCWRRKIRPLIAPLFDLADGSWRHPSIARQAGREVRP